MDTHAVLAAFDEQLRRNAPTDDGWDGIVWSGLSATSTTADVDEAIAAAVARFADLGRPWEWKHYSYDQPADLPARLLAAGFVPDPPETLLIAQIADLVLDTTPPDGIEVVPIVDQAGADAMVAVGNAVFGGDRSHLAQVVMDGLAVEPHSVVGVLAMAGTTAVCGARVEFHTGTEFASLWGGGTLPHWRGRGVFRSMVAYRAALAAERGFRYLQVDASPDSRPILRRLGFVELATTTPYVYAN